MATAERHDRPVRTIRRPTRRVLRLGADLYRTRRPTTGRPRRARTSSKRASSKLVPNVRVVQAVDFVSDDPANAGTMTMTWALAAVNAGTNVQIRADDVPAGVSAKDHAAGMASSLANLAAYVERKAPIPSGCRRPARRTRAAPVDRAKACRSHRLRTRHPRRDTADRNARRTGQACAHVLDQSHRLFQAS